MKVLHLIHTTAVGGVETAAAHLREVLGDRARADAAEPDGGIGSEEVSYRVAALAAAPAAEAALEADVIGTGVNSPRSALRMLTMIRRHQPDVLVTSLWRSMALGYLARALGWRGTWAVWVHNSRFTNPLDRLVHRWTLPRADLILCDSIAAREELVNPMLSDLDADTPTTLVRPDAPALPQGPHEVPSAEAPLRLVSWGRIAPQKRLERALDLVAELDARRPGGARLTLVGPDGGALASLREQIDARGLGEQVEILGPKDRSGLAEIVAASDVFVLTSGFEGFGMSAHEALAAGFVSILSPVGDLASDTVDGRDTLHYCGDAARTARRLLELEADPVAWRTMSDHARAVRSTSMTCEFVRACQLARQGVPAGWAGVAA